MRVTVLARVTQGLEAKLQARTARQKARVLAVMTASGERVKETAASLTPVDTGFMRSKLRLEIGGDGDRYTVGWRAQDFLGQRNPVSGQIIRFFYPLAIVFGSRFMAGRDPLTPAIKAERPTLRAALREALGG